MKLIIQVYGVEHTIPLTPGLPIQLGPTPPEAWDGPQDQSWLDEAIHDNCMGGGTVLRIGEHRFVSLHINSWRFQS